MSINVTFDIIKEEMLFSFITDRQNVASFHMAGRNRPLVIFCRDRSQDKFRRKARVTGIFPVSMPTLIMIDCDNKEVLVALQRDCGMFFCGKTQARKKKNENGLEHGNPLSLSYVVYR